MLSYTYTAKAASQIEMVQRRAARWVKNDYVQRSSVTRILIDLKVVGLGPEANRCETLADVQNRPQPHPDRSNKIC